MVHRPRLKPQDIKAEATVVAAVETAAVAEVFRRVLFIARAEALPSSLVHSGRDTNSVLTESISLRDDSLGFSVWPWHVFSGDGTW